MSIDNHTLTRVPGLLVGHAQLEGAHTGCTAILSPQGAVASYICPGSAPGSRETDLLRPENTVEQIHGLLFAGGSAFGLGAADGVVQFLESQGIGHSTPYGKVPIVPGAVIYDLNLSKGARPDRDLGFLAAQGASREPVLQGNYGAGVGASSGKLAGFANATKTGVGSWAITSGSLTVGALSVVNALGNVMSWPGADILAGARKADGSFYSWPELTAFLDNAPPSAGLNSILSVIGVSAPLSKIEAYRVAKLALAGLARAVCPAFLSYDGDIIVVMSTGVTASKGTDLIGFLASEALTQAVMNSANFAKPLGGLPGPGKTDSSDEKFLSVNNKDCSA